MDLGLNDRVAIITGSARGIGAETARMLAKEGASVVVTDLDLDAAAENARAIEAAGGKAIAVACDVRKEEQVKQLAGAALEAYGRIDVLVNNAGLVKDRTILKMDESDWDLVLDVTLKGAFHCCRAVLPAMHERGWGRIINISSRALFGNPGQANYSTAKAGILGLTRALSLEQARKGVTVNAIAPGYIETEYIKSLPNYETILANVMAKNAVSFPGQTSDIAGAVCFMASEHARYITGTTLFVTGGRYG
ncbi:SDR family NAD(P)-dependent oxidoreductase [Cupriavidus oxalaticus]|jgi:3-oxoacyl-[acyl-carrier protein] reductase|uniref:3-oxoacyl-(Acyl-carrier-protein) reductase FabG n=1 Tax=Cupriavidus oxalaticus TaxID=96344 RepID=A0A375GPU9_9BURK|nr:3-oxoacyl-ACP reductase FabG [Cupriavidus oxalaticus]QEZ42979.1 SDR family oxidoreductase [Cupriavidus oxalaticus]QRQ83437.1 3-oxoacyl-ACP reductase FabG [Cupriavidus oxalaticus]QRQ92474.1 3-oxoacyl-ACP reductase FabG [Cupriavidus oxalaticus]WQD87094.1 3-oxoacyl-ACP reductase FabG [Cupriavidus oxalaticus]SPC07673.1 3-oxoacyl-(acyl-carrier-protein) reductase FabG [Cupriavidus oxalaticus]